MCLFYTVVKKAGHTYIHIRFAGMNEGVPLVMDMQIRQSVDFRRNDNKITYIHTYICSK